ncbi:MAG: hypothetical protein KC912_21735 [Proteobacteria bacterium]|nr:hypothetical protein [Pseudomonadota bacterium]
MNPLFDQAPDALLAHLHTLTTAERAELAPEALRERVRIGEATRDYSDGKATITYAAGTDAQRAATRLVGWATASAEQLVAKRRKTGGVSLEDLVAIGPLAPPWMTAEGIDALIANHMLEWKQVECLVQHAFIEWPDSDALISSIVQGGFRSNAPLAEVMRTHPIVLAGPIYRVFEVEGDQQSSLASADKYRRDENKWSTALEALAETGEVERDRLLDGCLDALSRDFAPFRAGWYQRFYDQLKPTLDERKAHVPKLMHLLGSAVPQTIAWTVKAIETAFKKKLLSSTELLGCIEPALHAPQKSTAKRTLKLLERAAKQDPEHAVQLATLGLELLIHEDADLQGLALDFADKVGGLESAIQERADLLVASLRHRAAAPEDVDLPEDVTFAPRPPLNPLDAQFALTPAEDTHQAALAIAHALEHPADAMGLELALDAMARFSPDGSWDKPLLKRAKQIWKRQSFAWANPLHQEVVRVVLAWSTASIPSPLREPSSHSKALSFLARRLDHFVHRAAGGTPHALLSTPTHQTGAIEPATFMRRAAAQSALTVDEDAVLALMRLPPEARAKARALFTTTDPREQSALDACVAEDPRRFTVTADAEKHDSWTFYSTKCTATPSLELEHPLQLRLHMGPTKDLREQVDGATTAWLATATPFDLEPFYAGAFTLLGHHVDEAKTAIPELRPALHPAVGLGGPTGHALLCMAIGFRSKTVSALAADLCIDGLEQGRVDIDLLGDQFAELLPTGILHAKRMLTTLKPVSEASPAHARAVIRFIDLGLRSDPASAPKDIAALLDLLNELLAQSDTALPAHSRRWLEACDRSGKTRTVKKKLLSR